MHQDTIKLALISVIASALAAFLWFAGLSHAFFHAAPTEAKALADWHHHAGIWRAVVIFLAIGVSITAASAWCFLAVTFLRWEGLRGHTGNEAH